MTALLTLPRELRDLIYEHLFYKRTIFVPGLWDEVED